MVASLSKLIELVHLWSLLSSCSIGTTLAEKKSGWKCASDGFWYENGIKTVFADCDKGKEGNLCTSSVDTGMPSEYPRSCIRGPPNDGLRCWWTYVPEGLRGGDAGKVPLVIDMHGGGGCASHEASSSGWKELSDTLGADSFAVVWPQGYGKLWGTTGNDTEKARAEFDGKTIHSVDDLTFLENMVSRVVRAPGSRVDPERVFATGFSMGCMMSHRLALEKSGIIAGFGCHGGTLVSYDASDIAGQVRRFDLQRMPVFMTGGDSDEWFTMAEPVFDVWADWNGCNPGNTTTIITLGGTDKNKDLPTTADQIVRSSCDGTEPTVEVVRFELTGGTHSPDPRMARYTWDFLKTYRRAGALAELPVDPGSPSNGSTEDDTNVATRAVITTESVLISLTTVLVLFSVWL